VFAVKQTSADSTGCRALRRKAFEGVDREVVMSGSPSKSRRGSGPICSFIRFHRASKIQAPPAHRVTALDRGQNMSESTPSMIPSTYLG
jgi:hypothetical protein